jgi:hypothetical protein
MSTPSQQSTKNVLLLLSIVIVGGFAMFIFAVLGYVCSQIINNVINYDSILQQELPDL